MTNKEEIIIFGTEWCLYCKKAVELCEEKGVAFKYYDTIDPDSLQKLAERGKLSDMRTLPRIFIGNQLIGGYDDLQAELS